MVSSRRSGCVTKTEMVPSRGHGCETYTVVFWSAWPQTGGKDGDVLREPGTKKVRKREVIYALVRATAALSRETDWTLLMVLSS